jgi:aspartyl-tRNA(Asn)/glutamyl-tRNA(Gln) amidotransferase subunit A
VIVELPRFERWDSPRGVLLRVEMLAAHREAGWYPGHAGEYGEDVLLSLRHTEGLTALDLLNAYRRLEPLKAALIGALDDADVILLPTTPIAAPTHDEVLVRDEEPRPPISRTLTRICGPANACELAAVSVPCGLTRGGLPAGIQFVGRDESTVLGAALAYQAITDFHTRRPRLG